MIRRYSSAGAIVTTQDVRDPRFLLLDQVRKTGERQSVAPKGRLEPGEAPLMAAVREVIEEAGVDEPQYGAYLGRDSYGFVDNDGVAAEKQVDWFLFAADETTVKPAREEGFVAARWLALPAACLAVSHSDFRRFLDRAAAVLEWRAEAPLPFSAGLDALLKELATVGSRLLAEHSGAGIGVCGSAARGDFIEDWSDVDLIGWNLPADGDTAWHLRARVEELAERHRVRVSLHVAGDVRDGALHAMKMRAALGRVGIDTAIIAGAPPPAGTTEALVVDDLRRLREFAVGNPASIRRVLSVFCSGVRAVVAAGKPSESLRLPDLATAIDRRWPATGVAVLLRDYDAFRRAGAVDQHEAERLAARAARVLDDLIRLVDGTR